MNYIVIQRTDKLNLAYYGPFNTREEATTFAYEEEGLIYANQVCDVIPLSDPNLSRSVMKKLKQKGK